MIRSLFLPLLALAIVPFLATSSFAVELKNAEPEFSITMPDDFQPGPAAAVQGDAIYVYVRGTPGAPDFQTVAVTHMRSLLAHDNLNVANLQRQFPGATTIGIKWDKFDLTGLRAAKTQNGVPFVMYVVNIPIRGEGIGIALLGTPSQDSANLQLIQQLVASVKGKSSWDEEASLKAVKDLTTTAIVLGIVIAIVVGSNQKKKRASTIQTPGGPPPAKS